MSYTDASEARGIMAKSEQCTKQFLHSHMKEFIACKYNISNYFRVKDAWIVFNLQRQVFFSTQWLKKILMGYFISKTSCKIDLHQALGKTVHTWLPLYRKNIASSLIIWNIKSRYNVKSPIDNFFWLHKSTVLKKKGERYISNFGTLGVTTMNAL